MRQQTSAQPPTLAVFPPWGSSEGAAECCSPVAKIHIFVRIKNLMLSFLQPKQSINCFYYVQKHNYQFFESQTCLRKIYKCISIVRIHSTVDHIFAYSAAFFSTSQVWSAISRTVATKAKGGLLPHSSGLTSESTGLPLLRRYK